MLTPWEVPRTDTRARCCGPRLVGRGPLQAQLERLHAEHERAVQEAEEKVVRLRMRASTEGEQVRWLCGHAWVGGLWAW